jgi:hypothetical protein
LILLSSSCFSAGFGDLGGLTGKKKKEASVDVGSLVDQQSGIVETLVNGLEQYTSGQAIVARALGLKDEADILESEQEALGSGNVKDKGSIERSMSVTSSAQEAIEKKMEEGAILSEEAKKEFAKALPYYARGTVNSIRLLPEVKDWGVSASGAVKEAGLMKAGKLKKQFDTGMFIVKKLPKYVKTAKDSYGSMKSFFGKNEIDTSEADSLMDFDL